MKISIHPQVRQAILKHAEATYPNECCGFLFGKSGEVRQIESLRIVPNSKEGDQRRRFSISPEDYMKAERQALAENTELLGVFHSHPDHPAIPSVHDLKQAFPVFSYPIISVENGKAVILRSWRLNEELHVFEEEQIVQPISVQ